MINRVLDFSAIEAVHPELHPTEIEPREIAAACLDIVRPAAEAKRLALGLTVAPGAPRRIITDPGRLRQVLLNLLGNAVKFTAQGSVQIRLRSEGGTGLRIEVADTGPGIPAEQRERLFQDFERLDADSAGVEGAGLGLAISARLAALMGGRVGHDDNPAGGSGFWVDLPIVVKAPTPVPAEPTPYGSPGRTRPLRVLVVDDVAMNRDIASSFLRAAGHQVTSAADGTEAVEAVAATDFDAVLMDVRMPGMDGLEAARRIRALAGVRGRVPIIALTAQTFAEQISECRRV